MRRLSFALLVIFVFTIPWQTALAKLSPLGWTSSMLFMAVVLMSTVVTCVAEGRIVRPPAFVYVAFSFVCWQLTTYFWSVNPSLTLNRVFFAMMPMLAVVWLVTEFGVNEHKRNVLIQAFVLGCIVLALMIVQAYLSGQAQSENRYAPSDFSLNESADMLAAGIAMALLVIGANSRTRVLFVFNIVYLPLGLLSVVLTGSRSGFVLAMGAMLGVLIVIWKARVFFRIAWLLLFVGVSVGLFIGMSNSPRLQVDIDRVTFSTGRASIGTLTGRTIIWSTGMGRFATHPLTGTGAGTFKIGSQTELGAPWSAHSIFVETAAEGGIIGLGLLLALAITAVKPVLVQRSYRTYLQLILFLVLIGTSLVANFTTLYSLWFGLAILSANVPPSHLHPTASSQET